MGASSSKNVAKMMQQASIDISTEIEQSSSTGASASNVISQCVQQCARSLEKQQEQVGEQSEVDREHLLHQLAAR